ncbi:MAG: TIGR04086 family membrane protein [Clostridia bacterium]
MKKINIKKEDIFDLIRGTIFAILLSLTLVLILALIVNFVDMGDKIIIPINQVIKILSVFLGTVLGIKHAKLGALKGGIIGVLYTLLSIFIFGIISKNINLGWNNLIDVALGIVAGVISGIICVNIKK